MPFLRVNAALTWFFLRQIGPWWDQLLSNELEFLYTFNNELHEHEILELFEFINTVIQDHHVVLKTKD